MVAGSRCLVLSVGDRDFVGIIPCIGKMTVLDISSGNINTNIFTSFFWSRMNIGVYLDPSRINAVQSVKFVH